jgi:uncharacterized membrane protein
MMMSKMIASRSLQRLVVKTMAAPEKIVVARSFATTDAFGKKVRTTSSRQRCDPLMVCLFFRH